MEWMNLAGREQTVGLHLGRVQNCTKLISGDESQPLVTSGRGETGTGQERAPEERRAKDEAGSGSQGACIYLCAIFKDYFFLSFFFWPCSMLVSSPTRDQTCVLCSGILES